MRDGPTGLSDALACKPRLLRVEVPALLRSYGEVADDKAKVSSLLEQLVGAVAGRDGVAAVDTGN